MPEEREKNLCSSPLEHRMLTALHRRQKRQREQKKKRIFDGKKEAITRNEVKVMYDSQQK
jgi:hypothetical protein